METLCQDKIIFMEEMYHILEAKFEAFQQKLCLRLDQLGKVKRSAPTRYDTPQQRRYERDKLTTKQKKA